MHYTPNGPMGHYYDEAVVGDVFVTASRTITEADIVNFGGVIGDYNPLHFDAEYAKNTFFGQRIAHGMLTLSFATGLVNSLGMMNKTIIGFRGLEFSFKAPVFIGDTIHVRMETTEKQDRPNLGGGYVVQKVQILKQDGSVVAEGEWKALVMSRPPE